MSQELEIDSTQPNLENNVDHIDTEIQITEQLTPKDNSATKKRLSAMFPKWVDQENKKSVARDLLATERTWLAWVRTGNL